MWRDDSLLFDMLCAAKHIREYTAGLQQSEFLKNRRDQDAVLLRFTVLGESAKKVSLEYRQAHPEVPWWKITSFRNVVVHDYFNVDFQRVWSIADHDISALINMLERLVPPETP